MADKIVMCTRYDKKDGSLDHYVVTFCFDGLTLPITWGNALIGKDQLTNPDDLDEVKALACEMIAPMKDVYKNAREISDLNGPVTL